MSLGTTGSIPVWCSVCVVERRTTRRSRAPTTERRDTLAVMYKMSYKALINGKQVGPESPQRVGVWNNLLERSEAGNLSWKFQYETGQHLYRGTITKLEWDSGQHEGLLMHRGRYAWVTVPYEIVQSE